MAFKMSGFSPFNKGEKYKRPFTSDSGENTYSTSKRKNIVKYATNNPDGTVTKVKEKYNPDGTLKKRKIKTKKS